MTEQGPAAELFEHPSHPYTQALVDAVPDLATAGTKAPLPPSLRTGDETSVGVGCPYSSRCPRAEARCRSEAPALRDLGNGRKAACHCA